MQNVSIKWREIRVSLKMRFNCNAKARTRYKKNKQNFLRSNFRVDVKKRKEKKRKKKKKEETSTRKSQSLEQRWQHTRRSYTINLHLEADGVQIRRRLIPRIDIRHLRGKSRETEKWKTLNVFRGPASRTSHTFLVDMPYEPFQSHFFIRSAIVPRDYCAFAAKYLSRLFLAVGKTRSVQKRLNFNYLYNDVT